MTMLADPLEGAPAPSAIDPIEGSPAPTPIAQSPGLTESEAANPKFDTGGNYVLPERISSSNQQNLKSPISVTPTQPAQGTDTSIGSIHSGVASGLNSFQQGMENVSAAMPWNGGGPRQRTLDVNPNAKVSNSLGRAVGGAVPIVLGTVVGGRAGGAIAGGVEGAGSAIQEGYEQKYTKGQTAALAVERGGLNAAIGLIPGGKVAQGAKDVLASGGKDALLELAKQGLKGAAQVYGINVGQAGIESAIKQQIGIKDEGVWQSIKNSAASGDNAAISLLLGGLHAYSAARQAAEPTATPEAPKEAPIASADPLEGAPAPTPIESPTASLGLRQDYAAPKGTFPPQPGMDTGAGYIRRPNKMKAITTENQPGNERTTGRPVADQSTAKAEPTPQASLAVERPERAVGVPVANTPKVPPLEHGSGSWIISSKETGKSVAELHGESAVQKVNTDKYNIETAMQYLKRISRESLDKNTEAGPRMGESRREVGAPVTRTPAESAPTEAAENHPDIIPPKSGTLVGKEASRAKQPWEMTADELDEAYKSEKSKDKNLISEFFGKDADRYNLLSRREDSWDHKTADAAATAREAMESKLTKFQQDRLFGQGETGFSHEDLRSFADDVRMVEAAENEQDLANTLKRKIITLGRTNETDPAKMSSSQQRAYAAMAAAQRVAQEKRFDVGKVTELTLKGAIQHIGDPEEAEYMLSRFLKPTELPTLKLENAAQQVPVAGHESHIGQRGLSQGPPGPVQVAPIPGKSPFSVASVASNLLGAFRHLRERFSPIEAKYGSPIAKDFIKTVAAPATEARTIVADFAKKAFAGAPDPAKAFQEFTDLGRYYRLRDIQQRMPGKNVGAGLPPLSPTEVARIEADPVIQNAIKVYNRDIAPALTNIRQRNGLIMNQGASNPQKFPVFLNLPGEFEGPGGTDTSVNPSLAFNKAATGNSQLLMDPKESLEAAVRGHLATDYKQNLVKNLKSNFSIPQTNVVQSGKNFTANFHGKATDVVPVDLAAAGMPEDIHYIPSQIAHEYNNIRQDPGVHDTVFDKAVQAGTRLATAGDFSPHAARVVAHVAARQAQSGQNLAGLLPSWLGSNEGAVSRMVEMAKKPIGQVAQLLIDRSGSDKGAGFDVKPGRSRLTQLLNKPHDLLFDPDTGVDPMGRRVIADAHLRTLFGNDYMDSLEKDVNAGTISPLDAANTLEKKMSDAQFVGLGRKVNATLGFANKQTRSGLLNWASRIFPFVSSESGMIPREVAKLANLDPIGFKNSIQAGRWRQAALQLGGALATGAVGTYLASNALNYANTKAQTGTGRFLWDNDDGHKLDIWIAPGWHLSNLDPTFARGTRLLGIKGLLDGENWQKSVAMEAINEPLSIMAKTLQVAFTAASTVAGHPSAPRLVEDKQTGKLGLQPTSVVQEAGVPYARNTSKEIAAGRPATPGIIQDMASNVTGLNLQHDTPYQAAQAAMSPAEKKLQELGYKTGIPSTPEQKEKYKRDASATQLLRDGKTDEFLKATDSLPKSEYQSLLERAKYPDDTAWRLSKLSEPDALKVWRVMTTPEKVKYRDTMLKKLRSKTAIAANADADLAEVQP